MRWVRGHTSRGYSTVGVTRMVECEFGGEWRGYYWNVSWVASGARI